MKHYHYGFYVGPGGLASRYAMPLSQHLPPGLRKKVKDYINRVHRRKIKHEMKYLNAA